MAGAIQLLGIATLAWAWWKIQLHLLRLNDEA
jgi:hypothetical protein